MKIKFKWNNDNKNKKLQILLPNSLIKSKLIWKLIFKNTKDVTFEDFEYSYKVGAKLYKAIKDYIKANGHFVFMEIDTPNTYVKIVL